MAFAKRPGQAAGPESRHKPAKSADPGPAAAVMAPDGARSLLDDPDAASPLGTILRVVGLVVLLFVMAAGIALWMKPAEWWEDSALSPRCGIALHQNVCRRV